jgi:hypothetical protein
MPIRSGGTSSFGHKKTLNFERPCSLNNYEVDRPPNIPQSWEEMQHFPAKYGPSGQVRRPALPSPAATPQQQAGTACLQ